ncbi:MAG: DUF4315 family protein [Firmicutes bacterium]|nr:DUF4315 family protein [Bacillota bacterium]
MNTKIQKIEQEISKIKSNIGSYQVRCRELEQQKRELENTEIVGVVRSMDVSPDELAEVLRALRSGALLPQNHLNKEDNTHAN